MSSLHYKKLFRYLRAPVWQKLSYRRRRFATSYQNTLDLICFNASYAYRLKIILP